MNFIAVTVSGKACSRAPTPKANRIAQTKTPVATPAAVARPARRLVPREAEATAIMFGPGET
ncbi:hypothetical protein GGR16_003446 [Chelatococcus caeni]|uniref:Uncharacterized protein n=1 Tax=Chelatococcus caeni TaxID=1348468 RepID=A0A840C4L7_9HYPH|nr:hypothetical protein [Chelatococcus caeni]MBB4018399.1 hypothetical protein [Chelatococcus caeni]